MSEISNELEPSKTKKNAFETENWKINLQQVVVVPQKVTVPKQNLTSHWKYNSNKSFSQGKGRNGKVIFNNNTPASFAEKINQKKRRHSLPCNNVAAVGDTLSPNNIYERRKSDSEVGPMDTSESEEIPGNARMTRRRSDSGVVVDQATSPQPYYQHSPIRASSVPPNIEANIRENFSKAYHPNYTPRKHSVPVTTVSIVIDDENGEDPLAYFTGMGRAPILPPPTRRMSTPAAFPSFRDSHDTNYGPVNKIIMQ